MVGQTVRLLDGRVGKIYGFTFILDGEFRPLETSAEVFIGGQPYSVDVRLAELQSLPKQSRLLAASDK